MNSYQGWTAHEVNQLRELLGCKLDAFARRLSVHYRTVIRWRDGETDPTPAIWDDLDNLLMEAIRKLTPWLDPDQLIKMQRRDILKLLAGGADISLAGVDLFLTGMLSEVSDTSLSSFENITTALASQYNTSPPHTLVGSVLGHLEKAAAILRSASMKSIQRRRLESVVADSALFASALFMHTGMLAQADAQIALAEKMARQASNMTLLAEILGRKASLLFYAPSPASQGRDPNDRVALLEHADEVATRYAPAIVRMATSAQLAESRAAAPDYAKGADEALERSAQALQQAQFEGPVGIGFCSTAGHYSDWGQDRLEGYRGDVELSLQRASAVDTIRASLLLKENPRWRATGLVDLAIALIAQDQPEEACDRLAEAYTIGRRLGCVTILHHVFKARFLMPPKWSSLGCVRRLDDRLGRGWAVFAAP